mmetsp:Transcript_5319/g.10140  ORF Transcript_5319/g.10140 Transcript_5319/m.10140 type:complete len:277 (-) Transcript_5319:306-1136(-)
MPEYGSFNDTDCIVAGLTSLIVLPIWILMFLKIRPYAVLDEDYFPGHLLRRAAVVVPFIILHNLAVALGMHIAQPWLHTAWVAGITLFMFPLFWETTEAYRGGVAKGFALAMGLIPFFILLDAMQISYVPSESQWYDGRLAVMIWTLPGGILITNAMFKMGNIAESIGVGIVMVVLCPMVTGYYSPPYQIPVIGEWKPSKAHVDCMATIPMTLVTTIWAMKQVDLRVSPGDEQISRELDEEYVRADTICRYLAFFLGVGTATVTAAIHLMTQFVEH